MYKITQLAAVNTKYIETPRRACITLDKEFRFSRKNNFIIYHIKV